jgi:hypothetical protein
MADRRKRLRFLAVLLLLSGWGWARAQSPTVQAFVSPERGITTDRSFKFVIQVSDAGRSQVAPPTLPRIDNVVVIGGPNTSSSFTWTGGRSSSTYQLSWMLLAERAGAVEIPALEVRVDSRTYRTEAIRFTVEQAPAPGSAPRSRPGRRPAARAAADGIFLRAELGLEEAWVGQPVPLTVTLYTTQRISDPRWRKQPEFTNFWVENIEVNPDNESYRERIDDQVYTAYPIERKILIPTGAGVFEIDSYVAQMQVRLAGRDFFDIFGRSETIVRASEKMKLRVKPLPDGAPEGFGGAVGRYTLKVDLDRTEAVVDDAVALRVTVEGEGSLRSVGPPQFQPPPELTVFDPEVKASINASRGEVRSRKSWEWIIVPLAPGEIGLPELEFWYFDPVDGNYASERSTPPLLAVQRGSAATDAPVAHGGIQPQQRDLAFIKPLRGRLQEVHPRAHQRGLFVTLTLLPLAVVPLVIVVGRQRARLQQDQGLARARRAGSRARKRLAAAARSSDQVEAASFHEEVARALVEYVADRFNRSGTGLTYELADQLLASKGVDADLRRQYRSCLETCDFARYVPASGKTERRAEVLEEAKKLLEQLERAW